MKINEWGEKEKSSFNSLEIWLYFYFIDNLTAINDGKELEKAFHKINPSELELKKENVSPVEALFLDLHIKTL